MTSAKDVAETLSWLSPIGAAVNIASGDQPADMKAMNDYMVRTPTKTSEGGRLKTEWNAWFHDLSWYERNIERDTWMQARNRIGEFNLANAPSSKERAEVERIQKQGSQIELEMLAQQGKSAPIDVESGRFLVEKKEVGEGLKLRWVLLGSTLAVGSGLAAYVSPIGKLPLGTISLLSLLGTGTYAAFKIED